MIGRLLLLVWITLVLVQCAPPPKTVRVGAKSFEEQAILARMVIDVLQHDGWFGRIVACGDTYGCQHAMRNGEVDVMVEYSGTALRLSGIPPQDDARALEHIRSLYRDLGLMWLWPLGFDNAYVLAMPTARAAAEGFENIGDLTRLKEGIRVAAPSEYVRRAGDGLYPLLRRYGLKLAEPPLRIDRLNDRYDAVLEGRVDIAIGYATDGALTNRRLKILDDTLDFFPSYEATIVARQALLDQYPDLHPSLSRLRGSLDTEQMQALNASVQLKGMAPAIVAARHLRDTGIIQGSPAHVAAESEVVIVTAIADALDTETERALWAVRDAFKGRTVQTLAVEEPVEQVVDGAARMAVIGTERFFPLAEHSVDRDTRIEAISVLGNRLVHVLRRSTREAPALSGRIGILPAGTGGGMISEGILMASGRSAKMRAPRPQLIRALRQGALDAALIIAELPAPDIAETLATAGGQLRIRSLAEWLTAQRNATMPFLRPNRIPAGTYPGQEDVIETVGAQVVLAAPAPAAGQSAYMGGPGAALRTMGLPLSDEEVDAIHTVIEGEVPDPALPSRWSLRSTPPAGKGKVVEATIDTILNVAAWTFLAWLLVLAVRRQGGSTD